MREWLLSWIDSEADPRERMDSLPGVLWHLSDAWARRDEPHVVLVHYDDLLADLEGQMRRLADRLGIEVPEERWPELVGAATFRQMQTHADRLVPDPSGVLKDSAAFFRRGGSGAGRELLTDAELAHYRERAAPAGAARAARLAAPRRPAPAPRAGAAAVAPRARTRDRSRAVPVAGPPHRHDFRRRPARPRGSAAGPLRPCARAPVAPSR